MKKLNFPKRRKLLNLPLTITNTSVYVNLSEFDKHEPRMSDFHRLITHLFHFYANDDLLHGRMFFCSHYSTIKLPVVTPQYKTNFSRDVLYCIVLYCTPLYQNIPKVYIFLFNELHPHLYTLNNRRKVSI